MSLFDIKQYLSELEEVVNIDSGTNDIEGVRNVSDYFVNKFKTLKDWTIREAAESETDVPCIEIFNKDDEKFDVLLLCHIDTVFPRGTVSKRPFSQKDGIAFGPGVVDMKSCVLSVYYALKELEAENRLGNLSICVALNTEEEIGSVRSRNWIESLGKRSRYVIVTESARTNGDLVIFRKGLGRFEIDIHGKAAHAGVNPQDGISAILIMADWIKALHSLTDYKKGTTVNVGVISGGTAANVVPENATAQVDFRLNDMDEYSKIVDCIERLIKETENKGAKAVVTGGVNRPVMKVTPETQKFAELVDNIADRLGLKFGWAHTGGGSDGNFTGALGIPTLDGFGPVGGSTHSDAEYLVIDSIEPRMRLMKETIVEIGKNK